MHLDSEDLLARIRQDWPVEYELAQLRLLCDLQAAEIERLTVAAQATGFPAAGSYSLSDPGGSHA